MFSFEGLTFDDVLLKPQYSDIRTRESVDLSTHITKLRRIQIPLVAASMDTICESDMAIAMDDLRGIGVIHRFMSPVDRVREIEATFNATQSNVVSTAIGVKDSDALIKDLVTVGASLLWIDVAHADHILIVELLKRVKDLGLKSIVDELPVEIIVGNIATASAAYRFKLAGADAVKVGIGPGSLCTTRIVTGHGVPQLEAIAVCSSTGIPVIADGGIRNSGDIVKALAAGANAVMCGSLFAGCDETPMARLGNDINGKYLYRGMSSKGVNPHRAAEGVSTYVDSKGPVASIVKELVGGIRSGLSYSGAATIKTLQADAEWIRITGAGHIESRPHLLLH